MKLQVPIKIYYHVTLINDWEEITKSIFDEVVNSGLSADMERLYVGALGDESELPKLKELISRYPKTELREWSPEKQRWEGHTLRHLKYDADTLPKFYACYLHSKSVTRAYDPNDEHKNNEKKYEVFWKDYLLYSTVTRWRDCYHALSMSDIGYDVAACRFIPRRMSASFVQHGSGNMWWANSEYVKTLVPISDEGENVSPRLIELYKEIQELKNKGVIRIMGDVFMPESWLYTGQPLTYIIANAFTQGMPFQKTFKETLEGGYPIKEYSTDISHTL